MKSSHYVLIMITVLICTAGIYAFAGNKIDTQGERPMNNQMITEMNNTASGLEIATFAGGCFWCTESDFEKVKGVKAAVSGYTGGRDPNPSYSEVSAGGTGHTEAIQVYYDPKIVTYARLLEVFWRHINPTDPGGQFVDRGSQYRSEIFYHNDMQKEQALASRADLEKSGVFDKSIVTPVTRFETFYRAEDYHQDYYKKNKLRYQYYRWGSGRDQFLEKVWKDTSQNMEEKTASTEGSMGNTMEKTIWSKPDPSKVQEMLTPLQYKVTQQDGTEPPFRNAYWDNKAEGIYVDIVSGEPLFSSKDKFKSGTGWPSFIRPLEPEHVVEKKDSSLFMTRTEVRSRYADSHLGHLFDDGPDPTGLRYCINSAALRFISKKDLVEQGYGRYANLF